MAQQVPPALMQTASQLAVVEKEATRVVRQVIRTEDAVADLNAFQKLKSELLSASDYQNISGKNFIKKSGWRKLALVFNISDELVDEAKEVREDGSYVYKMKVRAIAPNGRFTVAVGSCDSKERKYAHPEHDVRATAHTRAKSRAISDLIGAGEVSAEEMLAGGEAEVEAEAEAEEQKPKLSTTPIMGRSVLLKFVTSENKNVLVARGTKPYERLSDACASLKTRNPELEFAMRVDTEKTGSMQAVIFRNYSDATLKELEGLMREVADSVSG